MRYASRFLWLLFNSIFIPYKKHLKSLKPREQRRFRLPIGDDNAYQLVVFFQIFVQTTIIYFK